MIKTSDSTSPATAVAEPANTCREKDIVAWIATYGPGLRRFFGRRAAAVDVDDLVQDVFLRLQSARTKSPIENVERYLFTVARHILISRHRADSARGHLNLTPYEDAPEIADNLSPERIVAARQEYARVLQSILDLPPRARAAFQLHRFENLTYRAIAVRMGISRESVKELMQRAIDRVSQDLEVDT